MKRGWYFLLLATTLATLTLEARACRFCRGGPDDDRYGVNDPFNPFQPNAQVEQYRKDAVPPTPTNDALVTNAADLAAAVAAATPVPGAATAPATGYRARLAKQIAAPAPAPVPVAAPATRPVAAMQLPRPQPLGEWTARFLDASILGVVIGLGLFVSRRGRAAA